MDENKIRAIVRDEIERNYRAGAPAVPPHRHNGKDNLNIPLENITGTNLVPFGNDKFSTPFLSEDYGFASPQKLGPYEIILNNLDANFNFNANALVSTVPIPVIYGINGAGFNYGNAAIGTMAAFQDPDDEDTPATLWVMMADGWYGCILYPIPLPPLFP